MEARSTKDLLAGVALAALGLYVTFASYDFTYLSDEGPGPGFLPFWLGLAIFTLALCLSVINLGRTPAPAGAARRQSWSGEKRALSVWLAVMSMILLSSLLSFTISLMLLTVFIIAFMEGRSLQSAIVVALGLGIGFHLIFVVMLGLSLPTTRLGF
ncbi:MAG TPA: tripartite tricarboxylate transporter TctB family protein [Candidatus Binatia bacterium]|nr:tripartite tricarboxylate transporter TctB family protein [Candidatus Binatia bacterium]